MNLLKTLAFVIYCAAVLLANPTSAEQPNVVLVITDDQGYGDLSCHGNPVLKTPNLDELYKQSIRLTDYHVAPTCSPTRAALQTGRWTNRTGVWHTINGRSMLRNDGQKTIGTMLLEQGGYQTGMFGKWHLGDNYPFRPEDRGYSEVLRHGGGGVGQTPDYWDNAYFDGHYFRSSYRKKSDRNFETVAEPADGFCTDVFFDAAKQFIKEQKDAGQPFFAYISTNAPHGPMHSPPEFSKPYADQGTKVANFLGMIANIDHNVGQLRKFLDQEGLTENTIFIFTTDNGSSSGFRIFNAQMRGNKGSEFDGGHRVPFFIHWPAGKLTGGKDVNHLTAHVDVLPTLLDLCDVDLEEPYLFDGKSIRPLLDNPRSNDADWFDRILVTDSQRVRDPIKWRKSSVMMDKWRLVNQNQLFDISEDPGQTKNVAERYPKITDRLQQFYEQWWEELLPTFDVDANIEIGTKFEKNSRLTSHDWITNGGAPWNQAHIRSAANNPNLLGHWNLAVKQEGRYQISIRRWPFETGAAINAQLPPGDPVPGEKPFRAGVGKSIDATTALIRIGDDEMKKSFSSDALEVVFEVDLEKGKTELSAEFLSKEGTRFGAYYAQVKKLD